MFQPAIDKAMEFKPDGIIYFIDGMPFDKPKKPNRPVLWVLPKGYKNEVKWGKNLEIEHNER